ncbi:MAG: TetR family transcriptional regulator [Armatimonadetes bacterium]|nr:TetR family transcriptional regulator [Armatimonadota bacterium]
MSGKRKEQSERLLQAAYDLVAEVGVSGLRTRDIAERAGVNLATVHYCFESKEALLLALYHFILDQFRQDSQALLAQGETPAEQVAAQTRLRTHFLQDQPVSVRVWRAFTGEAWTNATVREIVRGHLAEQRERLAAILAEGRRRGDFPALPTADDRLAASLLMSLYDGLMFQWAMDPGAFAVEDYAHAIHAWLGLNEKSKAKER